MKLLAVMSLVILASCAKPAAPSESKIAPAVIKAVIEVESRGNPRAIGKRGEVGLMQVHPATGRALGYSRAELFDPEKNVEAGEKYLAMLLEQFGDIETALAAYNAGPGRWRKGRAYARKVLDRI